MAAQNVIFLQGQYTESEDHLCHGHPEPHARHQRLLIIVGDSKWHVKVTFRSSAIQKQRRWSPFVGSPSKIKSERRREFQDLIQCIDFRRIALLHDTVTEVIITAGSRRRKVARPCLRQDNSSNWASLTPSNRFHQILHQLNVRSREDPSRIVYPHLPADLRLAIVPEEELAMEEDVGGSVYRVCRQDTKETLAYKRVSRPFYRPEDTVIFERELRNLETVRGHPNLANVRALVVSHDPYCTAIGLNTLVIAGFLLPFYPGGTLEEKIQSKGFQDCPWRTWLLHVGRGLLRLHELDLPHADLKPSNILIDHRGTAILIDVSGIGGATFDWTSPELRNNDKAGASVQAKKWDDAWAFGKIIRRILDACSEVDNRSALGGICEALMGQDPTQRLRLEEAFAKLEKCMGVL